MSSYCVLIVAFIVAYVIELIAAHIFFSSAAERKYKNTNCCLIGALLFFIAFLVNIIFNQTIWLNLIVYTLVNILYAYICFHLNIKKSLFYGLVLTLVSIIWEILVELVITLQLDDISFVEHLFSGYTTILCSAISKGLLFITVLILSRFFVKEGSFKAPLSFFVYPIALMISLCAFWYICAYCGINTTGQITLAIISIVLLVPTTLLFLIYQRNIEKENEFYQLKNEMKKIEIEKNYYDILEQQNQDLMIYAHDAKKHLTAIKNLNDNPQIEEYINIMAENLDTYSQASQSGNQILDIILNKYLTECRIKNIKLSLDIRLKNLNYVKDYDLMAILGNLLDNALESAEKSEKREITISTDYRNIYDILIITNSCDTAPKSLNNTLLTTKNDKKIHGIGIKSIIKTLKKYNGDYDWRYDSQNKTFTSIIMLSNTNNQV